MCMSSAYTPPLPAKNAAAAPLPNTKAQTLDVSDEIEERRKKRGGKTLLSSLKIPLGTPKV